MAFDNKIILNNRLRAAHLKQMLCTTQMSKVHDLQYIYILYIHTIIKSLM